MQEALETAENGTAGVWAIIEGESGVPIGSTRYMALRPEHHGLEIGWTWIGRRWWRTGANVETKLLLLGHAFDAPAASGSSSRPMPATHAREPPWRRSPLSSRVSTAGT